MNMNSMQVNRWILVLLVGWSLVACEKSKPDKKPNVTPPSASNKETSRPSDSNKDIDVKRPSDEGPSNSSTSKPSGGSKDTTEVEVSEDDGVVVDDGSGDDVTTGEVDDDASDTGLTTPDGLPGQDSSLSSETPLVLDWNRDKKVQTLADINKPQARFDLNADGFADLNDWVAPTEALLALDLDGNGRIDHGGELFGDSTQLPGGKPSGSNGFQSLSAYDGNQDGRIDARDPVFRQLILWQDLNSNGRSEADEMKRLETTDVTALILAYHPASKEISNAGRSPRSRIKWTSHYQAAGQLHALVDIYFDVRIPQESLATKTNLKRPAKGVGK